MYNSSLFVSRHYNFISSPPCMHPAGKIQLFFQWHWGIHLDSSPFAGESLSSIGVCGWMTTTSISVSVRNAVCLRWEAAFVATSINSTYGWIQQALPTVLSSGAVFQAQAPDTGQFLSNSFLQSSKPHATCIYLSFHFHRQCVPYTLHWQWLMSFTVWFHSNCLRQKAQCISLNKSSLINIHVRCPRCTLSLDLCS